VLAVRYQNKCEHGFSNDRFVNMMIPAQLFRLRYIALPWKFSSVHVQNILALL
jgi:hypothetical protein